MREATKQFFLKPYVTQFIVMVLVVVPIVEGVLSTSLKSMKEHFLSHLVLSQVTVIVGVAITLSIKFFFSRPVIRYVENPNPDEALTKQALQSASRMPLAEGIGIYCIWQFATALMIALPMHMKGLMPLPELLFMMNVYTMCALTSMTFFYLMSENSLAPFYEQAGSQRMFAPETGLMRISLTKKLLVVILLIAIPPIGYLLGYIYLNIHTGIDLGTLQIGFVLIIAQTVIMTFLNGYLLMTGLSRSVSDMSFMLMDMAKGKGDLTKRLKVTSVDEVGELAGWFNVFVENLDELIGGIRGATLRVSHAVGEVSSGSHGLSQTSQEQASSIEEIAATIEEMNSTVRNNFELVGQARESSGSMEKNIRHSGALFEELTRAMDEISRYSKRISDISVTVNEVAFQTNLLALNAAVEAARAGEQGRGFAVVAGEVRALAQRSRDAAVEIGNLIKEAVVRIDSGDSAVKKTAESFREIVGLMETFSGIMEVIGSSSTEQVSSIDELNRAIGQIDQATQQNASMSEELASTSESLREEADHLAEDVRRFKVTADTVDDG
jgi:methyl-accepting chemotaxis protein